MKRTRLNWVVGLSAIVAMSCSSAAMAAVTTEYLGDDVACKGLSIQGDWVGNVGADGYHLLSWSGNENTKSYPSYLTPATIAGSNFNALCWVPASAMADVRACTNAAQTQRSASTWYTLATGYIRIPVLADKTFTLGVYMLDWDQPGNPRRANLSVCDLSQEASPPSTIATGAYYNPAKWFFWRVSAVSGDTISIRVEKVNNNNTVSALAFDPCEQAFAFLADPNTLRLFTESSATFTPSIDPAGATGAKADLTATDEFVLSTIMVDGSDVLASGGDDVLTFTDGAACDQGAVTVNSWAMAGTTQLSITESDTDGYTQQGIAKATISVTVVPRVVRLNGSSTIGLAPGESADRMIEIVDATLAAPGRIDATIGTVTGGSATIEASGDTFIADAARTSTGTIHITASPTVAGITSTTITLGNNFVFQETGTDTLDLKVLVLAGSTIYVSGTGSDTTGDGTELNPFRTIALACTPSTVSEIRVLPGIYSEDDGEVFPINVPAGVSIAGTMGPEQDETDTTVIDAGEAAYAFVLEPTTAPTTGALSSVKVVNFKTAADVTQWRGTIDNCVFTANAPAAVDGVLFYGAGGAVEITVSNTDVKDIRSTGARGIWRFGSGSGSVIVSRCLFSNITVGYNVDRRGIFNFEYPSGITFKAYDTIFEDLVTPGQDSEEGGMLLNVQGGLLIDRCVWRNITYTGPVINPNRTPGEAVIRNTLFQNVSTGTTNHGVVGCVYTTLKVTNCTFHNCSAAFDTGGSPSAPNQVWNCTVSNDTAGTNVISKGGIKANLHLHHVNIHNTEPGIGYDADNSDNVTTHDPAYRDASAGNFRLRKTSPLIDAGTNTPVTWPDPTDLDGKPRIMDGNADDDPVVDLGAYEYDPNVLVPTFTTAQPAYRIFAGATLHVPVSIAPSAGGAVTADVTFGTDLSGPATLDIPDGVGPASLAVTAASVLSVDDGTLTFVGLAEATSQGVDAGEFGVYLHNRTATVGGKSTLFVRSDSTVDVKVSLLNELCTAPGTISITTGTPGGSGTNTIGWMGDAIIPDGQRESTGALSITGGTGTNTITLGIDNGFTFQESSGAQLTIKVVGFASPLYVSGEGSDTEGEGTELNPLRTIAFALACSSPTAPEIRVLPGLYDAEAGESFPITLPAACSLVGTVGANEDDTDSAFIDAGGAANALVLAQSAVGQTGLVRNLVITNFKTAFLATKWRGTIDGCVIKDNNTAADDDIVMLCDVGAGGTSDAIIKFSNCIFKNLSNTAAKDLTRMNAPGTGTFTVEKCTFQNITTGSFVSQRGQIFNFAYTTGPANYNVTITDTLFDTITVPGQDTQETGSLIYTMGNYLVIDRCTFRNFTSTASTPFINNRFIGFSTPGTAAVRDCLFYNVNTGSTHGVVSSFSCYAPKVTNCTFDTCTNAFGPNSNITIPSVLEVSNTGISNCGKLNAYATADKLLLRNVNIWNTESVGQYDAGNSVAVTAYDPLYNDAPAFDFHLGDASPLIDAGDTAAVTWDDPTDLDGLPRIVDGDNDDNAVVDIGCYEYQGPEGATITAFTVTDRTSGSTLVTNEAAVNVAITVAAPEGITVVDWQITESDVEPTEWLNASPTTCTIQGASGADITLYAWIRDSADNVKRKPATIYWDARPPVVSNVVVTDNADSDPPATGTATATWDTDIPAQGSLNYGPVSTAGATPNSAPENGSGFYPPGTSHSVTFAIAAGTNYKIVLVNTEIASPAIYWPLKWPIEGDANLDCRVNILDLIFIRNKLNQAVGTGDNWKADVNEDARINILDLIFVRNKLNTQCPQ